MPNLQGTNEEVSEEAESNLQAKLNDLNFGDVTDPPEESDDTTSDDQTKDAKKDDQTDDSESEDGSTSDDQDDSENGSKGTEDPPEANDKVEIPEAYIRAAKRQKWSDEDIAEELKANPERALRLFMNAYETSNKATRDFAAIGRQQAEQTAKELEEKNKVDEPEIKDYITPDEIEKAADGDAAIAKMLTTMNRVAKEQAAENAKLRKTGPSAQDIAYARSNQVAATARANASADAATELFIEQFFSAENMKSYNDFYGTVGDGQNAGDLTANQHANRLEVLQTAGQLIAGKAAQGIKISDAEALEDAHLLVTEPMREKVITDKIRSSLKKRGKGKTLQPSKSQKTSSATGGPARNKEEVLVNVEARLAKLRTKGL